MRRLRHRLLAVLTLLLAPALLPAQATPDRTVDVTLGAGSGWSRFHDDRAGPAVDLLLAFRGRAQNDTRTVIAGTLGVQGLFGLSSNCNRPPDEGCLGDFPLFYHVGVVAGYERGAIGGATARLLAGPTLFRADDVEGEGITPGIQARVDLATATRGRVALVGSARGVLLPRFQGGPVGLWSVGLGLRID